MEKKKVSRKNKVLSYLLFILWIMLCIAMFELGANI